MVSQFRFRQFLFACQARILGKLDRHIEVHCVPTSQFAIVSICKPWTALQGYRLLYMLWRKDSKELICGRPCKWQKHSACIVH